VTEAHRTEDERVKFIRALLNDPIEQTAPNNQAQGWRRDCDYLLTELDDKSALLIECEPHLRTLASQCESCEGSGEILTGPSDEEATSEPCTHCRPIWDLIERIEPPAPQPVRVTTAGDYDDDLPF
jgi:hypothetical protein